jgi:hypothetical protein
MAAHVTTAVASVTEPCEKGLEVVLEYPAYLPELGENIQQHKLLICASSLEVVMHFLAYVTAVLRTSWI